MPRPDPVPTPRHSTLQRFRQAMRWLALFAIAIAGIAVALVAHGDTGVHIHMLIATALGVGLAVFLGTALMLLSFLSSSSGHDEHASRFTEEKRDQ